MPQDPPAADPPPDLGGDWHLDAEPGAGEGEAPAEPQPHGSAGASPSPNPPPATPPPTPDPPSAEQIVEALLFVGGDPLTAAAACRAVRGLTPDGFLAAVDALGRRYRRQRRPYGVVPKDGGFGLAVLPAFRGLRERLVGGPREARLGQPALDVLSVVAYRQPVGKAEVDAVRGADSGAVLRQLVRLGLVAVRHRAEAGAPEVRYGTTPRFLSVFGLASLDDLPRLGDTSQV
ncbi:MAG: SMC-Scp complex subunit ScpB [Isosphaera sp.]|nr:SMC-Scp complex subunit ScpB [Isosphaera sp.]